MTKLEKANLNYKQLHPSPLNKIVRSGGLDETKVAELAASIELHGVIQPLTIFPSPWAETPFEILIGERRWRAAALLGKKSPLLPCVIVPAGTEGERLVLMGVENIQRENLSPLEEGRFYQALLDQGLTLEQVIQRMGKTRPRVKELLALITMPQSVQRLIESGAIPITAAKELQKLAPTVQEVVAAKMAGQKVAKIKSAVRKVKAHLDGRPTPNANGHLNGDGPPARPEAEVFIKMVSLLLGIIEQNGDLLAQCADSLTAFDVGLAEEAFDSAVENRKIVEKMVRGNPGAGGQRGRGAGEQDGHY